MVSFIPRREYHLCSKGVKDLDYGGGGGGGEANCFFEGSKSVPNEPPSYESLRAVKYMYSALVLIEIT